MIENLNNLDTQLFRWINGHYSTPADWLLWTLSQSWSWAIVLILFFVLVTLRQQKANWWMVILGVALCFLLGDRISVMAFKDLICRPRPCHALEDVRMFHTGCGGMYGFISSHAANIFSLVMFLCLQHSRFVVKEGKKTLSKASKWMFVLMFLWAILVGYSRPYLGKHYPGDVICGAIVGMGIGALVYFIISKIKSRVSSKEAA